MSVIAETKPPVGRPVPTAEEAFLELSKQAEVAMNMGVQVATQHPDFLLRGENLSSLAWYEYATKIRQKRILAAVGGGAVNKLIEVSRIYEDGSETIAGYQDGKLEPDFLMGRQNNSRIWCEQYGEVVAEHGRNIRQFQGRAEFELGEKLTKAAGIILPGDGNFDNKQWPANPEIFFEVEQGIKESIETAKKIAMQARLKSSNEGI